MVLSLALCTTNPISISTSEPDDVTCLEHLRIYMYYIVFNTKKDLIVVTKMHVDGPRQSPSSLSFIA